MSKITTHILDTSSGNPATGVRVELEYNDGESFQTIAQSDTDQDGRVTEWTKEFKLESGEYRLMFHTGAYFATTGRDTFFPHITIDFSVADPGQHYHVPLLMSPFGYSTYRGS